ncbi:NPCBM/NEW2 domain-containing protein [Paenibacillus allorhizosphaerae]|uniref:Glycosyl hydrolase family 98 putative carbohydrate-binding module domain-containing protein n=1 Tax=Paenibacillus allorhizosphaerae TaxID=2849866 RepID=A0ABN7TQI9_9BACL|nr:NPCBM/NEW2 domain-containing protein [Paenibacillus allorhizosphaerae]CAG7651490.1 hypothetical protein PAECIP111802_04977 [Paenibacillus allorhizosphaerae]
MKEKIKGFIYGCVVTSLITGSVAYAANPTSIEVYFKDLKYKIDGLDKTPSEGQGFIYEGTTYVPLRFIGESLGKNVEWDGDTETIWVGKREGRFTGLTSLKYARTDGEVWTDEKPGTIEIAGTKYKNGIRAMVKNSSSSDGKASIDYNLNGNYKRLTALVGMDDASRNVKALGIIKVIGDGKELKVISKLIGGDNPINVDVDVTGVLKLQIVFEVDYDKNYNWAEILWVDFLEPKLFE